MIVSFEIPVHQKLTVGTKRIHQAATRVECVFSFKMSSKIRHDEIAVKYAKISVPAK